MFGSVKQKHKIYELDEQAKGFQISTDAYLVDNLERATQNEMVDDALLADHTRNFIAHKRLFNNLWNRYMQLKKRFAKDDERLLRVTEQWQAYWKSWFATSINHYSPEELAKLADERQEIIKEFEAWETLSDKALHLTK
ncbi:MAG: hypothetical protein A3J58_01280 [Candidatus Sungbacteria bacterium RIFCSPHIGHO2_02_FULL_52_23]|uniref:Uncharacterized protein n=1 Tax=Candidatus Sungbacteria bacterium RIFCSPHIGHO2_02_FULL_52_23 TaxID=1802274 RepID=A0A1G2KVD0_9BACT|nr:MAG: hypothetical protein A3J58_01280 [Candidatus Sungbacteria bacterium RIFCSPHIGHO2_02_FULL_52_23]